MLFSADHSVFRGMVIGRDATQQDAEKLFFGITMLLGLPENKGLTGAEVGQKRPLFGFFSILLVPPQQGT